jgi:transcriptional regulator with XRE-family HTH domain
VSDVAQRFAENLSYYHEQSGLTQEALASRAEIHRTQVSDLLRGKQVPRLDTLVKLAGALGVPPAKLVENMSFEPVAQTGKFRFPPPKRKG